MPVWNRREAMQLGAGLIGTVALGTAKGQGGAAPRIKVGQIGTAHAHAARTYLTHRESPDFEVVGLVEPDEELRRKAEANPFYKDATWMTQDQLLSTPGLEGVLVETRVGELLDAAEACVDAGKHVHIDKPAGESLAQLQRIMASAQRQNLLVQMGYVYRHNPAVVLLREFLAKGWLGEVFEIHGVMSEFNMPETRRRLAEYQGGMMFELGCHLIDVLVAVMGKPDKVAPVIQHVSPLDDGLADNMLAVLTTPKVIATVKSSAMEVEGQRRRQLTVCGTEGTFHIQPIDKPTVQLTLAKPRGRYKAGMQEISVPKHTRYVKEAAEMASVIRGQGPPLYSYEHDLAVQETLLAACGLPLDT